MDSLPVPAIALTSHMATPAFKEWRGNVNLPGIQEEDQKIYSKVPVATVVILLCTMEILIAIC